MPRDISGDDTRDRASQKRLPTGLKRFLGDLAVLGWGFLFVLAVLAVRLYAIWLHEGIVATAGLGGGAF